MNRLTSRLQKSDLRIAAGVAAIIAASFIVYWPCLRGDFIWDDWINIVRNRVIRSNRGLIDIWLGRSDVFDYYPLTWTTWWLEWRAWRKDTLGYHVLNVLLHAGGAAILWRVLWRLKVPAAFVIAIIFAVHPVNVESVAWITERKNTLSMLLMGISLALFIDADEGRGGRAYYWASVVFFGLMLLAKPSAIMLPAVLLVIVWWKRGRWKRSDLIATLPYWPISAFFAAATVYFHHTRGIITSVVRTDSFVARLESSAWVIWFYLSKLVWPFQLSFIYPRWRIDVNSAAHWMPMVLLLVIVAVLWTCREKVGRGPLAALLGYTLLLLPVLGFIDIYVFRYTFVADHLQYQATWIPITLVVASIHSLLSRFKPLISSLAGIALALACIVGLGIQTWRHARDFESDDAIWASAYRVNPTSPVVLHNYALTNLASPDQVQSARDMFMQSMAADPTSREVYLSMGRSYELQHDLDTAITWYRKGVGRPGSGKDPRAVLAAALALQGKVDAAIDWYEQALAGDGDPAAVRGYLAELYEAKEKSARSLELRRDAALDDSENVELWYLYAETLFRNQRNTDAQEALAHARQVCGENESEITSLGIRLMTAGFPTPAAGLFSQALQVNPDYAPAHGHLARAYELLGRKKDAIAENEAVLKLQPGNHPARLNLDRLQGRSTTMPTTDPDSGV